MQKSDIYNVTKMVAQTVYISVRQVFYVGLKLFFTMQIYSFPTYEVKLPDYYGYKWKLRMLSGFLINIIEIQENRI